MGQAQHHLQDVVDSWSCVTPGGGGGWELQGLWGLCSSGWQEV